MHAIVALQVTSETYNLLHNSKKYLTVGLLFFVNDNFVAYIF